MITETILLTTFAILRVLDIATTTFVVQQDKTIGELNPFTRMYVYNISFPIINLALSIMALVVLFHLRKRKFIFRATMYPFIILNSLVVITNLIIASLYL